MKKSVRKAVCMLLASALLLTFCIVPASASVQSEEEAVAANARAVQKTEKRLKSVSNRNAEAYASKRVYYNERSLGNIGRVINGVVYIPIKSFVESVSSAKVTYNSSTKTLTVSGGGHNISVSDGAYAVFASGRVLFSDTPARLMSNGVLYAPLSSIAKALSLNTVSESSAVRVRGTASPIKSGDKYYREDEVYWLARIISAESRGEPLLGQIAVGNIILNRVRSKSFPNTIWGVIFDRKWGVQFSPVANGSIYNTPTASCILAAKICLEGFSVSEDALYFIAPAVLSASWIQKTREYSFSIGGHDFYI